MDQLDTILEQFVAEDYDTEHKLLGASFVVVSKDGIVHTSSAGRLDMDPDSPRFSSDAFTWVASLTKIITTTCVMQLVERRAVSLDDNVCPYVPELAHLDILRGFDDDNQPILERHHRPVPLRILLNHTVGLGYDLTDPDLMKWSKSIGRTETNLGWTREGFTTPAKFRPGEGWYYGSAIDWAGLWLESFTGKTLSSYIKENIFDPLGMQDSVFSPAYSKDRFEGRTVTCTYRQEDGSLEAGALPVPERPAVESGGAGLFTTAGDYSKFLHGLLSGILVSESTLRLMLSPQLNDKQRSSLTECVYGSPATHQAFAPEFPLGLPINHGFGGLLGMQDVPGKRRSGSMSWCGMCNSRWWLDPKTGIAAVLITNVQPLGDEVVAKLYDALERAVYASRDPVT